MERPNLHLCIDRVVPMEHKIKAAELARKENRNNEPKRPRLLAGASIHPVKMALLAGKKWQPGRTLTVAFLDGSKTQQAKVIEKAQEWCKYANMKLRFNAGASPEIRISFQADPGSWSAVGTDCFVTEAFPKDQPTMNFGWLTDDTRAASAGTCLRCTPISAARPTIGPRRKLTSTSFRSTRWTN